MLYMYIVVEEMDPTKVHLQIKFANTSLCASMIFFCVAVARYRIIEFKHANILKQKIILVCLNHIPYWVLLLYKTDKIFKKFER